MTPRNERDFWSGVVFLLAGGGFSWGALGYKFGSSAQPGPGYFPFTLGIVLAALGLIQIFNSVMMAGSEQRKVGPWPWKAILWIVGGIAIFGLVLPYAGLLIALPLLMITTARASEDFRWQESLLSALVVTLGSWLLFVRILKLEIPLWPKFLLG
jgi:hypothetical protein